MEEVLDDFNPHKWAKTEEAKLLGPLYPGQLQMVSFGGGTDSTAVLIGLRNHGIKPDKVLFADTGGERPHVYDHVQLMSKWTMKQWGIPIETVKRVDRKGNIMTLENWCLEHKTLPSLAFGHKKCSQKFKIQPQDKAANSWPAAREVWKKRLRVIKYIGYEASEARRIRPPESLCSKCTKEQIKAAKAKRVAVLCGSDGKRCVKGKYRFMYPLVTWNWYRFQCLEVIKKEGLPMPGKSSCFFCPASTKKEIVELAPDLLQRALAIEKNAAVNLINVKGLGRRFSWDDMLKGRAIVEESMLPGISCDCNQ